MFVWCEKWRIYCTLASQSEIVHGGRKSTEVRWFSPQLWLAIVHMFTLSVLLTVCPRYECVCVCAQQGHSHVCLEQVLSVSWNVALPPILRWLPNSKMAARIRASDTHTQRSERLSRRSSFFHSSSSVWISSETALLFLLSNLAERSCKASAAGCALCTPVTCSCR